MCKSDKCTNFIVLPLRIKNFNQLYQEITLISIGITAIYLIISVATLLFLFSFFITTNEITPLYNATRYIELGNFFQRLESVFLIIWIFIMTVLLAITFLLIA